MLEHVEVGDIVTVKHSILGIDIKVKVISLEKDILSAKNTKVELGQPRVHSVSILLKSQEIVKYWLALSLKH